MRTVLARDDVRAVPAQLHGVHASVRGLLYGGLMLLEALRPRANDIRFRAGVLVVRQGRATFAGDLAACQNSGVCVVRRAVRREETPLGPSGRSPA